jgi:hypothetical protein
LARSERECKQDLFVHQPAFHLSTVTCPSSSALRELDDSYLYALDPTPFLILIPLVVFEAVVPLSTAAFVRPLTPLLSPFSSACIERLIKSPEDQSSIALPSFLPSFHPTLTNIDLQRTRLPFARSFFRTHGPDSSLSFDPIPLRFVAQLRSYTPFLRSSFYSTQSAPRIA